ncbi:MAG: tetratricopeptide repeat protein [Acholeplasmataceae bacterium]|jgi:TPR repeat protein
MLDKAIKLYEDKEYEESYRLFKELVKTDDKVAGYYLGSHFLEGRAVEKDEKEGFKWFFKSANKDYAPSQYVVSQYYLMRKLRKGIVFSIEELEENDEIILKDPFLFPGGSFNGISNKIYLNQGLKWLLKSANNGFNAAKEALEDRFDNLRENKNFLYLCNNETIDELINYQINEYNRGSEDSANLIGMLYENEFGQHHDYKNAFKWYGIGATQYQIAYSEYRLGVFYKNGHGTIKDIKKSLFYLNKVIEREEFYNFKSDALFHIGKIYFENEEYEKGLSLIKEAGTFGDSNLSGLWFLFYDENNIKESEDKFDLAISTNSINYNYFYFYDKHGNLNEKVIEDGIKGLVLLGYNYAHNTFGVIDYLKAYHLYQRAITINIKAPELLRDEIFNILFYGYSIGDAGYAALKGDVGAQLYKGCLYQWGYEIPKDLEKAMFWYEMAAENGSSEAIKQIEIIKQETVK